MRQRPMLSSLLVAIAFIQLGLPLALHLARNRMIFLPSQLPPPEAGVPWIGAGVDAELVWIVRPDGRRLAAYDAIPSSDPSPAEGPVVLFFHGNAGNLAHRADLLGDLVRGFDARILMFDYSGYGGNPGSPSETEVVADGLAAYDHLADEGIDPARIVLFGESLGGGVALAVANDRPCAGVVLQSSFSSLSSMAWRLYPWLPLGGVFQLGSFPNARRAAALGVPLLLVHGRNDEIIPYAESEALLRAAPPGTELLTIEGAGHNDLFPVAGAEYLESLGRRFRAWVSPEAGRD